MCKKLSKKEELVLKLSRFTAEYEAMEKQKTEYYILHKDKISRTVIITLSLQQDYIDTLIKKICALVERLKRSGIAIENECAMKVFQEFRKAIHMGLL